MAAATIVSAIYRSSPTLTQWSYRFRPIVSECANACHASLFNAAYPSVPRFAAHSLQQRSQICTTLPRSVEPEASYPLPPAPKPFTSEFAFAFELVNPFCTQHCLNTTQLQLFHH